MISLLVEKLIVNSLAIFYGILINCAVLVFHVKTRFRNVFSIDHSKRPEALDDPIFRHHRVTVNEKKIHYVTTGNSDNPMIVFLHGFPDFWFTWSNQLIEFGNNYFAVAIDLPGLGESQKVLEDGQLKVTIVADEVAQVIRSIIKSKGQQVILVGHDWGACVSYCIASQNQRLVSKLVILNGPHPVHFRKFIKTDFSQFLKSWYMIFFNSPFWPEWVFQTSDFFALKACFRKGDRSFIFDDIQLEPWKYIFNQPFAIKSALGYYRDFVKRSQFLNQIELPIHQQLLIIWGKADRALSLEFATQVNEYAVNARVEMVEDAGHFVQLERPEKVNRLIKTFIEDV